MGNASIQLIDRPKYLQDLSKWAGQNDLVKIVTGVRRCGWSKTCLSKDFATVPMLRLRLCAGLKEQD